MTLTVRGLVAGCGNRLGSGEGAGVTVTVRGLVDGNRLGSVEVLA
jgi:hypothetical protein